MNRILEVVCSFNGYATAEKIAQRLKVRPNEVAMVKKTLDKYVSEGKLLKHNGKYASIQHSDLLEGTVCATLSGADFFQREGMEDKKICKSRELMLMHNDVVLAKCNGDSCRVVKIVKRGNTRLVGTLYREGTTNFFVPDEKRIHEVFIVPKGKLNGASVGDKCVAQITAYPTDKANGLVNITESLGPAENSDTAIKAVLYRYGIPFEFKPETVAEAATLSKEITEADLSSRLDLRKLTVITIDGEDAKDLDDAVSLEMTEKGDFLLGVHIADVSHYVKLDGNIDMEARERGTSVYIPGKVFPMLPTELSNGVCSLNEGVDRLTISCFMVITRQGKTVDYSIQPSVIRNKHRMTYSAVTEILEDAKSPKRKEYKDIFGMLVLMRTLAQVLIERARMRGNIDFDLPEAKIVLDNDGYPEEITKYEVGIANKIIEQFMLAANETVAAHMRKYALPCVYRVHEAPEAKKIETFKQLIESFGYTLTEKAQPKDFQKILDLVKGKPEEILIRRTMLRSMSKAKYKPTCDGHFGLAYENYLHFTSPIRRYPDLTVHRSIKMSINNKKALPALREKLEGIANTSTATEINAATCERDVEDIRKAQYMCKHIGREFSGTVSGVTAYGLYVELDNTCEGFIPIGSIEGYFDYDEANFRLVSMDKQYRLGDTVKIKVFAANVNEGKVEFTLLA